MANVDMAALIASGYTPAGNGIFKEPYLVTYRLSWAAAATTKGSALAAADVIFSIDIPAGTVMLQAGATKVDAPTGTVSVCTLSVGPNGAGTKWVNAFDYFAAAAGDPFTLVPGGAFVKTPVAATTVDLTITSLTGTLLTGNVDIWVLLADPAKFNAPGIAALKS